MTKENDPLMKTSELNKNDPSPYYPHFDPALHPKKQKKRRHIKRRPDVYEKDPKAYYGPIAKYEVINTLPHDGKKTKIVMKDLSELNPSEEKIIELQRQLNNLNNFISLPKNMLKRDKGRHPYYADPNAYYDPTKSDVEEKKKALQNKINLMKKNLKLMQENGGAIPELYKYEKVNGKIYVENRVNSETEKYNKYMKDMLGEDDPVNQKKSKSPALGSKIQANFRQSHHYNTHAPRRVHSAKVHTEKDLGKTTSIGGITFSTISSNYDTSEKKNEKEVKTKEWKNGKKK